LRRQGVKKVISGFLLALFLFGLLPKEYLHRILYRHRDTVDVPLKKGEVAVGCRHVHCTFLSFAFAPYLATEKTFLSFSDAAVYTRHVPRLYSFCFTACYTVSRLRGPPAIYHC
jgi:hypothetical protein